MASSSADDEMTLRMLTLELQAFHSLGGLTFKHRRQPLTLWFVIFSLIVFLDTMVQTVFDYVLDYDEQLFFAIGNIPSYFFGASYRYFSIVFFYKTIGLACLILHVTSDFSWIELVDRRLLRLGKRVIVTRMEMGTVVRNAKLLNLTSIQFWLFAVFFASSTQIVLFHYDRLSWFLVLPTFVNIHIAVSIYTYLHWCLLGQYYLILSYCFHLVRGGIQNVIQAVGRNNNEDIKQALSDFEVIASCVHWMWQYTSKIYVMFLVAATSMIPVFMFNATYANISVYLKGLFPFCALYFLSVVSFLSYLPGRIDMQLEPAADRLYGNIINKKEARSFSDLHFKCLQFELHALSGLGLSVAGYRINLSTCITLATVYVTVFSFFIHSRNSVGRIEFVQ